MVDKKDVGRHGFCVDFIKLNAVSKPLEVPLLLINDILALPRKAKSFSTIGLMSGYWQVSFDEADLVKATFACDMGLLQFSIMPFGLVNAIDIFQ